MGSKRLARGRPALGTSAGSELPIPPSGPGTVWNFPQDNGHAEDIYNMLLPTSKHNPNLHPQPVLQLPQVAVARRPAPEKSQHQHYKQGNGVVYPIGIPQSKGGAASSREHHKKQVKAAPAFDNSRSSTLEGLKSLGALKEVHELFGAGAEEGGGLSVDFVQMEAEVFSRYCNTSKEQLQHEVVKFATLERIEGAAAHMLMRRLRSTAHHTGSSTKEREQLDGAFDRNGNRPGEGTVRYVRVAMQAAKRLLDLDRLLQRRADANNAAAVWVDEWPRVSEGVVDQMKQLAQAVNSLVSFEEPSPCQRALASSQEAEAPPESSRRALDHLKQLHSQLVGLTTKLKAHNPREWMAGFVQAIQGIVEMFNVFGDIRAEQRELMDNAQLDAKVAERQTWELVEQTGNLYEQLQASQQHSAHLTASLRAAEAETKNLAARVRELEESLSSQSKNMATHCGICGQCMKKSVALEAKFRITPAENVAAVALGKTDGRKPTLEADNASSLASALFAGTGTQTLQLRNTVAGGSLGRMDGQASTSGRAEGGSGYMQNIVIGGLCEAAMMKRSGYRVLSVLDFEDEKPKDERTSKFVTKKLVEKGLALKRIIRNDPSVKVFVHCMQGINRSVAAVIVYLLMSTNLSLEEVSAVVKQARPVANVMQANTFYAQLKAIADNQAALASNQDSGT